jgi:hypothetical protein
MFVGEVYSERLRGCRLPPMLSEGSPVRGSIMATNDRQVSAA